MENLEKNLSEQGRKTITQSIHSNESGNEPRPFWSKASAPTTASTLHQPCANPVALSHFWKGLEFAYITSLFVIIFTHWFSSQCQVQIYAAYGSVKDISVYASIGIKPQQIYTVGKHHPRKYTSQAQVSGVFRETL